jgi:hypothetical protein
VRGASAWSNDPGPQALPLQGFVGMNRWVGLGVIADNIFNIGRAIEKAQAS